jgi:membrane associated rhomboid family serine protease
MKRLYRQFISPLSSGVLPLLLLLTVCYVLTWIGSVTGSWDLWRLLGLNAANFWHGRFGSLLSYSLVPATLLDAVFNWIFILVLGSWLERQWNRAQMWLLFLTSTLASGCLYLVLFASSPLSLAGTAPVVFGFLAAWGWLCGRERVLLFFLWEMSVRTAAALMTAIVWLTMALGCVGPVLATVMLAGSLGGLAHIWVYLRWLRGRPGELAANDRIGRLEL